MTTVEQRAAVYAAFGEPVRLAIVDRLALGDASPGELAEAVGLASNLLAHHLHVLERGRRDPAGAVRGRPPAQLCPAASGRPGRRGRPSQAGLPDRWPRACVPRVVFVCTANSARSQLAAASGGTRSARSRPRRPARTPPRGCTRGPSPSGVAMACGWAGRNPSTLGHVVQDGDLIVAVCDNVHEELAPHRDRLHWSIPDPVRVDTDEAFESAYVDITRRVEQLAAAVAGSAPTAQRSRPRV